MPIPEGREQRAPDAAGLAARRDDDVPAGDAGAGPGRLAYMFAVPSTCPSGRAATVARLGGATIPIARAVASSIVGS